MPGLIRRLILGQEISEMVHCYSRCVQQYHLCGQDPLTGQSLAYRKRWIEQLFQMVASLFAVDFVFEAVMSNHIHLMVRTRPDVAKSWDKRELARRWLCVTKLKRNGAAEIVPPTEEEIDALLEQKRKLRKIRKRMANVSWLMGTICENISRRCNREAGRTGHFWESRFQSRRLLSPAACLLCGLYIDLNMVMAGLAQTPEASRYTSIWWRLQAFVARHSWGHLPRWQSLWDEPMDEATMEARSGEPWLAELTVRDTAGALETLDNPPPTARCSNKGVLELELETYLELLDCVGREVRADKKGAIPAALEPILIRIGLRPETLHESVAGFDRLGTLVGTVSELREEARKSGRRHCAGQRRCARAFIERGPAST